MAAAGARPPMSRGKKKKKPLPPPLRSGGRHLEVAARFLGSPPNPVMLGYPLTGHSRETGFEEIGTRTALRITTCPPTRLERSHPAADATREVVERWLLDGLM